MFSSLIADKLVRQLFYRPAMCYEVTALERLYGIEAIENDTHTHTQIDRIRSS